MTPAESPHRIFRGEGLLDFLVAAFTISTALDGFDSLCCPRRGFLQQECNFSDKDGHLNQGTL